MGQPVTLQTGDLCYYWRDTPAGHAYKLKWRGPATVIMREPGAHGPHTDIYWIGHGTVLIRAAPEHVKPARAQQDLAEQARDPLDSAKQALGNVRNRGVTHYIDLTKTNKRNRDEVDTDEELEELDEGQDLFPGEELPPDRWQISEDQRLWTRIHNHPRRKLFVPEPSDDVPIHMFKADRVTDVRRGSPNPEHIRLRDEWRVPDADRELHYTWTGTTTFILDLEAIHEDDYSPESPLQDDEHEMGEEEEHSMDPSEHPDGTGSPGDTSTSPQPRPSQGARPLDSLPEDIAVPELDTPSSHVEPEPMEEPTVPSNINSDIPIPEHQQQLYQPTNPETFAQQRQRVERQETLLFRNTPTTTSPTTTEHKAYGPVRHTEQRETPYSSKPLDDEAVNLTLDVDIMSGVELPTGWKLEQGHLTLDQPKDDWILEGHYLTRRHFNPRQEGFVPTVDNCPLPLKYLAKDRYSKVNNNLVRDKWTRPSTNKRLTDTMWTGYTRFKILATCRKDAKREYSEKSKGMETMYYNEAVNTTSNGALCERTMSLADRLTFMEAKKKELQSFFDNSVWEIDEEKNADPTRILRAKFLLNWKRNPDGSPRPKARLVVQGFKDPDAWSGNLNTTSPTLTRLSRNYVLTIATMLGMTPFTSDISTAFLQGKQFDPNSNRVIWVRLPKDGEKLLGLSGRIMKLIKPMYGLCDAPRAWYEAASQKILTYGAGRVVQHPLDACLFLVFDKPTHPPPAEGDPEPRLLALFGMHVDDLFGCYLKEDKEAMDFIDGLRGIFNFREWITGDQQKELEYCGAQIVEIQENHWKIYHKKYLDKQKPISYAKERKGSDDEVTERERTALRGLIGALQWPSTQTSPHLQAMTSNLAGQISKATTSTLDQANKALRYAKENSDVGLEFRHLGSREEVTFIAYSDASFASRADLTSQGGYLVAMVHKSVTEGQEGYYNILDWRSWKLARVARSTLSAESQAASEAADALLFATTFWNLIWQPWLPLDQLKTAQAKHPPKLVIDAKALYDLLIKDEVQAATNADKRTAIEVLVTQDKLKCCGASTMWVSSELQYADGLTKTAAAQLLADRMRSHLTKLKSDETFTASKKKTAKDRKTNTERYAIQKPSKTMATVMFASFCTNLANAQALELYIPNYDTFTFNIPDTNMALDETATTIMSYFIYLMTMIGMMYSCHKIWSFAKICVAWILKRTGWWKDGYLEEANTPRTKDAAVQKNSERPGYNDLIATNQVLEYELEELTTRHRELERDYNNVQQILLDTTNSMNQMNENLVLRTIQAQGEIYFTRHGRVWHASHQCARSRTEGPIFTRGYCTFCVGDFGRAAG